eukprot:6009290-Karenia_brevis.AAC.1
MLPEAKYTASRWHNRVKQKLICNDCKPPGIEPTFQCGVCISLHPESEYEQEQWRHRFQQKTS